MKQKTMVLIVLAVICGLGASFMTSKLLADRQQAEDTTKVLVARKKLNMGDHIKKPEDAFEEKEVSKETAPKDALTKFEDAKGRQMKIPRHVGDIINKDDLMDSKDSLGGQIPPGHRAVGIRVAPEDIAAGFAALPLSRVDISCLTRGSNDKDLANRVVLQNVLVLASDTSITRAENGQAMPCGVVTVALTTEDALKLDVARTKGNLKLLLRPFGDSTRVSTAPQNWQSTLGQKSASEKGLDEPDEKSVSDGSITTMPSYTTPKGAPAPQVKLEEPKPQPFVTIVRHGNVTERIVWSQDAEGQWSSRSETVGASPAPAQAPSSPQPSKSGKIDPPH